MKTPSFGKKDGLLKRTEFFKMDGLLKRTEFFKMDGLLKRTEFFITYRRYKNVYFLKLPNIFILLQISGDRHEQ